jgi:acetyl-CoA acyltransferase
LIDGLRTPFLKSNGAFKELMSYELAAHALRGVVAKSGVDPNDVELVALGTVVHDPRTSNVAREAMLAAGFPHKTPAFTTALACISANVAATNVTDQIALGRIDVGIAGGTDTCSDPPIRLSKNLRQALVKSQKAKGAQGYLEILKELSPEDLIPDIPSAAEFSTGLTMGQSCERFAKRLGITRTQSDEFAARSHVLADRAWKEGRYADEVMAVPLTPSFDLVKQDDGPRGDSTVDSLAKLKPAFDKEFGLITAASSSFLSDGASAVLFMSREKAEASKTKFRAIVRESVFAAGDPLEELLAGPALAVPVLLERTGLKADQIGVWEVHEAFSAQVLANLKVLKDTNKIEVPLEKLNVWGGSVSLGHPFGATGGRLLTTAAHRHEVSGERYAIVTGCAAGGHGSAILLENPSSSR